jgi:murein L,D-transpeptidase YafK
MKLSRVPVFAALAVTLAGLGACTEEGALPRNGRHYVAISMETQQAMRDKNMRTHAPILIRAFKKDSELEVWKQDASGKMALLKTYPMCRWSGQLGPKTKEGDRQVPEGFYSFAPGAMNPNSNFYLSFNVGYPNQLDKQLGRNGSLIMVHGDCSSMGCYAMTDNQISDIYGVVREAFAGGQTQIQVQSYPFRMTPENLAKYRNDQHMPFWKNLKQGHDTFEIAKQEPKVSVCNGKYAFNASSDGCSPTSDSESVRSAVAEKNRNDEIKVAELVNKGIRPMKRIYRDGDMHPVFKETILAEAGGATTGSTRSVGRTRNGISRAEAVAFTPVDLPIEQYQAHRSKGRTAFQIAELTHQEKMQAELSGTTKVEPAKAEPAKAEPVKAAAPKTEVAKVEPNKAPAASAPAAAAQPVASIAATPAEPAQKSAFQRMLGTVGLSSQDETKAEKPAESKVEEVAPQRVTIPLPPRRQAGSGGGANPQTGPQAYAPSSALPSIISDTQRLSTGSIAGSGFAKRD